MERFRQIVTSEPLILGILLAIWGGMVRGVNCKREDFRWSTFFFRVFVAGFVGSVMGLAMKNIDYPVWIETAIVGISGYAAVDLLPILSSGLKGAVEKFRVAKK